MKQRNIYRQYLLQYNSPHVELALSADNASQKCYMEIDFLITEGKKIAPEDIKYRYLRKDISVFTSLKDPSA